MERNLNDVFQQAVQLLEREEISVVFDEFSELVHEITVVTLES